MLKTDKLEKFNWDKKRSINIIVNKEYKTVIQANEMLFGF